MSEKVRCRAYARSTGKPCQAKALPNGRCKLHGGMSTGPKTPEGRQAIAMATKQRMFNGQLKSAKLGFKTWLETGGRERLSRLAKARLALKKLIRPAR